MILTQNPLLNLYEAEVCAVKWLQLGSGVSLLLTGFTLLSHYQPLTLLVRVSNSASMLFKDSAVCVCELCVCELQKVEKVKQTESRPHTVICTPAFRVDARFSQTAAD